MPFVAIMHGRWPVQISPVTAAGWRWFGLRVGLFTAAVLALAFVPEAVGIDPDRHGWLFIALVLGLSTAFVAYLIPAMLRRARRIDVGDRDAGGV